MKIDWSKLEIPAYLILFIAGLALRWSNLETVPLSAPEATHALQALDLVRFASLSPGDHPLYLALTSLFFFQFGDNATAARLVGVLAGASLIWAPFFLRQRLGNLPALVLAAGLALDPFLVAFSRQAGGPILALSFTAWAGVALLRRWDAAASIFVGLALLSGPAIWLGLAGVLLAFLVYRLVQPGGWSELKPVLSLPGFPFRRGMLLLFGTFFLAGSLFTLRPAGLSDFAASFITFVAGFTGKGGLPAGLVLLSLAVYQTLALTFVSARFFRLFRGEKSKLDVFFLFWMGVTLLLILLKPARQPEDLAWVILPLWVLAARELGHLLSGKPQTWYVPWMQGALILVLMLVGTLNLAAYLRDQQILRLAFLGGLVVIGVIVTLLIGAGWNNQDAVRGVVWGLTWGLGLLLVGEALAVGRPETSRALELWQAPPATGQVQYLQTTLGDLAEWNSGRRDHLQVHSQVNDPVLRWALRNHQEVAYTPVAGASGVPPVIITSSDAAQPALSASYRGQDFIWQVSPDWEKYTPLDWLNWLLYRRGVVEQSGLTLWARGDLFPGGELVSSDGEAAPDQPTNEDAFPPLEELP
jgi:4-amino-4-deoxy-L-arabinose transferase-like glycosyltransferase